MRKLYSILMMAVMAMGLSFTANADLTVTLKVDDATRLTAYYQYTDPTTYSNQQVTLDLTQFTGDGGTFTIPASYGTVYVNATDGNVITSAVNETSDSSNTAGVTSTSFYLYGNATLSVTSADLESTRTASCTVTVDDASKVKLTYYTGNTISLVNGENTVKFNPNGEVPFVISHANYGEALYSVKLNDVEQTASYSRYQVTVADGDRLNIAANFPEEPSTITFSYGDKETELLGCVSVKVNGTAVEDFDGKTLSCMLGDKVTIVGDTNLYNYNYSIYVDGSSTYFSGSYEFTVTKTSYAMDLSHVVKYATYVAYITVDNVDYITGVYPGSSNTSLTLQSGTQASFELTSNANYINIKPATDCYVSSIKVNDSEYGSNYGTSSVTVRNINENDAIEVVMGKTVRDKKATVWVDDLTAAPYGYSVYRYSDRASVSLVSGEEVTVEFDTADNPYYFSFYSPTYCNVFQNGILATPQYEGGTSYYLTLADGDKIKVYLASDPKCEVTLDLIPEGVEEIITCTIDGKEYADWVNGFTVVSGTEVSLAADDEIVVLVNGEEVEPDADGVFTFTVTDATVEIIVDEPQEEEILPTYPDAVADQLPDATLGAFHSLIESGNVEIAELAEKSIRRAIVKGDYMYVLALNSSNEPSIYVINVNDYSVTEVATTGVATPVDAAGLKISDIAVSADGYLMACNLDKCSFGSGNNYFYIYNWEKDADTGLPSGTPAVWYNEDTPARFGTGWPGMSMTFNGNLNNGAAMVVVNRDGSAHIRFLQVEKVDGVLTDGEGFDNATSLNTYNGTTWLEDTYGESYKINVSPTTPMAAYMFDGSLTAPVEFSTFGASASVDCPIITKASADVVDAAFVNSSYFKYAGHSLLVTPILSKAGYTKGVKLVDVTAGLENGTEVETTLPEFTTSDKTAIESVHTAGRSYVDNGEGKMDLFLLLGNKLVKYTSGVTPAVSVTPTADGTANPYAYGLTSEYADGTLKATYSLNTDAKTVYVGIKNADGEAVALKTDAPVTKGTHTVELSLPDNSLEGTYTWTVEVEGETKESFEEFFSDRYYHPRGVDVDNNMESPAFGTIYVTEGMSTTNTLYYPANNGGVGLYAFTPDMAGIKNEKTGKYAFMSDLTYSFISYGADLARVRVAEDGRIFVTRCNNAGDYILYAPSLEDLVKNNTFTSLLAGGELDATTYTYNTADGFLAGPNVGFDVKGSGEDLKLATVTATASQFAFSSCNGSVVSEYALGEAEVLPAPTQIDGLSNYTIAPQCTNVEYDNLGGMWYCQYSETPSNTQPALIYVDANGEQQYFEGAGGKVRGGGGIRFNPDFTQLAIATSKSTFSIYDVYNLSDGSVELVEKTTITHNIGTNVYDIAWDLAGNIYICGNSGEYLKGFAMPREGFFVTKSASQYSFEYKKPSAIEEVGVEAGDVEYYNLQGVKVNNPENGVFIKKQGGKATKVVL